jgi:PTS system ascorbate-specific IIA component
MPALLIVAHMPLASALQATAAHVYPAECAARVQALDVLPEWSAEEVETRISALLAASPEFSTLILTDAFGATPCNGAQRVADGVAVRLIAGVNVPMLWRTLCYVDEPLDALVDRAMSGGSLGLIQVPVLRPHNQTQLTRRHDQDHAHHQQ